MISKNALLVEFSVSQWTARKLDRKVTKETTKKYKADENAGRWNKLLAAPEFTEPYSTLVTESRKFHYDQTLVWSKGLALVTPKNFIKYRDKMLEYQIKFQAAVKAFLRHYDSVIDDAHKRLGKTYNEKDFPSRAEIMDKFEFSVKFFPLPENDFRVSLSAGEIDKLKKELGVEINNRMSDAVRGVWQRINKQLLHMRERLMDKKKTFHYSMYENMKELIDTLPNLNITNDPSIDKICEDMKKLLVEPDNVRDDVKLRAKKAAEVQQILNNFGGLLK